MTVLPIELPDGFIPSVSQGDTVISGQILAKKEVPQDETVNIMQGLSLSRKEAKKALKKGPGEKIYPGDVIAAKKNIFGKVKAQIVSQISGIVLRYERDTGNLHVRTDYEPSSLQIISPVAGKITLCNNKEIRIETENALVSTGIALGETGEGTLFVLKESFDEDGSDNALYYLDSRAEGKIVFVNTISRDIIIKGDSIGAAGFLGVSIAEEEVDYIQKRGIKLPVLEVIDEYISPLHSWENRKIKVDVVSKAVILQE